MRSFLPFAIAAALALAACGKVEDTTASSTSARVWRPTSTNIEVRSFGYWVGSTGYAKARADLTPEQLSALDGLHLVPTPENVRSFDNTSYRILVGDADGSIAEYRAAAGNLVDGDEGDEAVKKATIDFDSLSPFLATMSCLAAKEVSPVARGSATPAFAPAVDVSKVPALPSDVGCQNGVFVPSSCSDSFLRFEVASAETYELRGSRCVESMSLRAYSSDGTQLLASSTPASGDTCFTLRYAFAPGRYLLQLIKTNAAGCDAGGSAGDANLSVARVR